MLGIRVSSISDVPVFSGCLVFQGDRAQGGLH